MNENQSLSRKEFLAATVVSGAVVILWFLITWASGAVGIARNDDWSYLENAFRFGETGVFAVGGWVQMMLIGQLVLSYPVVAILGDSIAALQVLVAILGVLALVCAYALTRRFLARSWAVIAVGTLAISVPFGLLSVSYMTDVPAMSLQLLSLALAARAFAGAAVRWPWLIGSSASGLLAFSVREYAITALVAVWIVALVRVRETKLRSFIFWTVVLGLVVLGLLLWRAGQVTVTDSPLGFSIDGLRYLTWWPLTLSWLLLPALAALNPLAVVKTAWSTSRLLSIGAVALVLISLGHTRLGLLGNYLSLTGGYAEVIRGRSPVVLPSYLALPLTVLSVIGAFVLALLIVIALVNAWRSGLRQLLQLRSPLLLVTTFVAVSLILLAIVPVIARVASFDRYFLAIIPLGAALILWWAHKNQFTWQRKPLRLPILVIAISALASVILVAATSAWDGARWSLARSAAADLGVSLGNVDGGFDYYNFHSEGSPPPVPGAIRWTWWTAWLAQRAVCASVTFADYAEDPQASGPANTLVPITRYQVSSFLANPRELLVYQGPDTC